MPLLMCPNCETGMQEITRNSVKLDICSNCKGVWLDRGELEKLLEIERNETREHDDEENRDREEREKRERANYQEPRSNSPLPPPPPQRQQEYQGQGYRQPEYQPQGAGYRQPDYPDPRYPRDDEFRDRDPFRKSNDPRYGDSFPPQGQYERRGDDDYYKRKKKKKHGFLGEMFDFLD